MWDDIRHKLGKVEWHKVIWFNYHIPRNAMLAWMIILARLPAKQRITSWGLSHVNTNCVLCDDVLEI